MSLDVHEAKGVFIVQPNRVRLTTAEGAGDLREALTEAIQDGRLAIAINLNGVEYADASTIDVLIDAYKALAQAGGCLCLFNPTEPVRDLFQHTMLYRFIHVCSNETEAVEFFSELPKRKRKRLRWLFS